MSVNIATVTTVNRVRLYVGQPATSDTTIYTVPASTNAKVSQVVMTNTTASDATVFLSGVPSGGSSGVANRLFNNLTVAASAVVVLDLSVFLDAGDFLSAYQGTASAITLTISGETYA